MTDVPAKARYPGRAPIDAYGNGGFRFAGMSHKGSILCLPDAIVAWRPTDVDHLSADAFAEVLADAKRISFLLLGTGASHRQPPSWVRDSLAEAGVGLDVMATGAAARTWNVLLAEGRPVAAALMVTD